MSFDIDPSDTIEVCAADFEMMVNEIKALQKDLAHWQNNHATEVRRARILKERPDMPIERVEAYEKWGQDIEQICRLSAESAALREERDTLAAALNWAVDNPNDDAYWIAQARSALSQHHEITSNVTTEREQALREAAKEFGNADEYHVRDRLNDMAEATRKKIEQERDALAATVEKLRTWIGSRDKDKKPGILISTSDPAAILAARDARVLGPALDLLDVMFSAYENGPDCYEYPDDCAGHLGKAVKIDDVTFHAIADLLNKHLPLMANAVEKDAGNG